MVRIVVHESVAVLVYGCEDDGGAEPLIAVLASEDDARALERSLSAEAPQVRVRWETHVVVGGPADVVHVVFLDAGGRAADGEACDPIGLAAFADREGAVRDAASRRASGEADVVVRPVAVGWRREGWPTGGE